MSQTTLLPIGFPRLLAMLSSLFSSRKPQSPTLWPIPILIRKSPLRILFILVLLLGSQAATAQTKSQEPTIALWGHVFDSFTRVPLAAKMTIMHADSTVVDTVRCTLDLSSMNRDSWWRVDLPRREAHYIIRAEMEGYEPCYVNYHMRRLGRNTYFDAPWHFMKRKQAASKLDGEHNIDEVVIKATKIRMVQRGDTLIFDASAFQIPEGNMLDALVRQLPGAQLKDNGEIYINGEKVDYITLNGSDFFKGKNKIMLDNLPYYTVKNLQVYHKSSERSRFLGHDVEKKDYVMDVNLKREYSRGLLANIETGTGSNNRYLARLFSLAYGNHTRYSVFGNTNNVNESRTPGGDGSWTPSNIPVGLTATRQAGLTLQAENRGKTITETLDATTHWGERDNEERIYKQTFASNGDILGYSRTMDRSKYFDLNLSNKFVIRNLLRFPFDLFSNLWLYYSHGKKYKLRNDSTSMAGHPVNSMWENEVGKGDYLNFYSYTDLNKKLPWGDNLELQFDLSYNSRSPFHSDMERVSTFYVTDSIDHRHTYYNTPGRSYKYKAYLDYVFHFLSGWELRTYVNYGQSWQRQQNDLYRLDWLPTAGSDMQLAIDHDNTRDYRLLSRDYISGLAVNWTPKQRSYERFSAQLTTHSVHDKLNYQGARLDTLARRQYFYIEPKIGYELNRDKTYIQVEYSGQSQPVDFISLMPYYDTSNPTIRRINNPELKNEYTHYLQATFRHSSAKRVIWHLALQAHVFQHSKGTQTWYDRATGIYTYRDENVNGNRDLTLIAAHSRYLDAKRHWDLYTTVGQKLVRNVGFNVSYDLDAAPTSRIVHTYATDYYLSLTYSIGSFRGALMGNAVWNNAQSHSDNFQTINAWDYNYGASVNCMLPWRLSLGTDIKMYSRRGYQSSEMNTNDLVWNAQLSRSFIKRALTAKLQAFDLLHQLSNTTYSINAQGRTETWNKCLPRYVMFSLMWKFQKMPKRH